MLVEQALKELSKNAYEGFYNQSSNIMKMISIKKLYKEARMYMNQEEISAIQSGRLREYLSQFSKEEEDDQHEVDLD